MCNLLGDETVMAQDSHIWQVRRAEHIAPIQHKGSKETFDAVKRHKSEVKEAYGISLTKRTWGRLELLIGKILANVNKRTAAGKQRRQALKPWENEVLSWYQKNVKGRILLPLRT